MSQKTYLSMIAREDLSDAQYKILNVHDANGVKLRVAAGAGVLGVLDNKPKSGENRCCWINKMLCRCYNHCW